MIDNPDDPELVLIDDTELVKAAAAQDTLQPWLVLIVDDDPDVHAVTRMALRGVHYKSRPLNLLSAYSGDEGFQVLSEHPEVALVFLDVVMESPDAGLKLVSRIRNELKNQLVRIVLRTGQPGQAPEKQVIVEYDINDYKAKADLTTQQLFTCVIASLRAYESLLTIESSRQGLKKILDSSSNLYEQHSLKDFASGVLKQIGAIINCGLTGALCVQSEHKLGQKRLQIMAASGEFEPLVQSDYLPAGHALESAFVSALQQQRSVYQHPVDVMYFSSTTQHEFLIAFTPSMPLSEVQLNLLDVFCNRIAAAFVNLHLFNQVKLSQQATVVALARLAEYRDNETGEHVLRVQHLTDAIVQQLKIQGDFLDEITPVFEEMVGMASVLHDVGKVGTPDNILFKPGLHNPDEREVMEKHVNNGGSILEEASHMVEGESYLSLGAQIAMGHHEHFDGQGYPQHLEGDSIPLAARVVALADVFDALLHRRPYKEPWTLEEAVAYIRERAGKQFDPRVVAAFLNIIQKQYPELKFN